MVNMLAYQTVWIGVIVVPATKNAASKNHPKDILNDKLNIITFLQDTSKKHVEVGVVG